MRRFWNKMKEQSASAMVESVIVLPVVFIVVYSLIVTAFMVHDKATIEAAAHRGVIFASHCITDPNYARIVGISGELDVAESKTFAFTGIGKNINAYRYITGGNDVSGDVEDTVTKIVEKTRIGWQPMKNLDVDCKQKNRFLYQDVTVTVKATYPIPKFFGAFGLDTEYEYSAEAKISTTDPDEFIRNADLVVDLITRFDRATGGNIGKAFDTISKLGDKITDWIKVDK